MIEGLNGERRVQEPDAGYEQGTRIRAFDSRAQGRFAYDGSFDDVAALLRPVARERSHDQRARELLDLLAKSRDLPPYHPQ